MQVCPHTKIHLQQRRACSECKCLFARQTFTHLIRQTARKRHNSKKKKHESLEGTSSSSLHVQHFPQQSTARIAPSFAPQSQKMFQQPAKPLVISIQSFAEHNRAWGQPCLLQLLQRRTPARREVTSVGLPQWSKSGLLRVFSAKPHRSQLIITCTTGASRP